MEAPSKKEPYRVCVVILNWNGCKDTLECLESVYRNQWPGMVVYVADNGSTDNSAAEIRKHYPQCRLLELGQNFGFAEGNNQAVQVALQENFDFILLINNDTVVDNHLIEKFVQAYEKLGPHVALGAKIGYYDEPNTIWDFGSLWDEKNGSYHKIARNQPMDSLHDIVAVDHIIGCAMFIPASIIRQIGLFDRRFFLNYEETDWCVRACRAGFKLYSVPDALVWHKISRSFIGGLHNKYFISRNRGLWLRNFSWSQRLRWFWLKGQFQSNCILGLKTILRLATLPFWIGLRRIRLKQAYRLAQSGIKFTGWLHHLVGRYGDCPDWVKYLSRQFKNRS